MDRINLSVGSGGKLMKEFLSNLIIKHLGNEYLNKLLDSAHLEISGKVGFTTDSFVINPIFFKGGDIGKIAVAGTINDLVVAGIKPLYLSLGLIIEEGFLTSDLEKILISIRKTADEANVKVVTGDTKVVKKGEADKIYINTAGIGEIIGTPCKVSEGDVIIVTGTVGDHSVAVMIERKDFDFEGEVFSDCQPLHELLPLWKIGVKWMRDITRGGLATILCELAEGEDISVYIEEKDIPLSLPVKGVSEILGIDPLYLASEGKALLIVDKENVNNVMTFLKSLSIGKDSSIIGKVGGVGKKKEVVLKSISGGLRLLEPLTGELLPRIC